MNLYEYCCSEMKKAVLDPEILIRFVAKFRDFGLNIQDGGSSYKLIKFCPWCGAALPNSLRDRWFDSLETLGIDPTEVSSIPEEYQTSAWYFVEKTD